MNNSCHDFLDCRFPMGLFERRMLLPRYLLVILISAFAGLVRADDSYVPTKWYFASTATEAPANDAYYGGSKLISYFSDKDHSSEKATYISWGKFVYKDVQHSKYGSYQTDIVEIRIDCPRSRISILREIKLDKDGKVVSDRKNIPGWKTVDPEYDGDLNKLQIDLMIARQTWEFTCTSDAD